MAGRIALVLMLALLPLAVAALPIPGGTQEAPESLLDLQVGDADVSLFLSGGWTSGAAASLGVSRYRGADGTVQTVFPYPFPGLETVPFFNTVDLTLSLWLLGRYFFETTISDELTLGSMLFGYAGAPGEFVQSVLIGNTAIDLGGYPYLGFGDATGSVGRDAPGVAARFQTPRSSHEFMVRLEPSAETEIRFAGGNLITESIVDAADYLRNRFFVLPDGNLDTIAVYAESASGSYPGSDGRMYRPIDLAAESSFSLTDGTLSFPTEPAGRILVYYESSGQAVGDPSLGSGAIYLLTDGHPDPERPADLSFTDPEDLLSTFGVFVTWATLPDSEKETLANEYVTVTVDGRSCLVLLEPGRYSPFERANWYEAPVPLSSDTAVEVRARSGGAASPPLRAVADVSDRLVSVQTDSQSPRAFGSRYPFAAATLDNPVPELYGLAADRSASRFEISFTTGVPADAIVLDADYIPGSVRITKNGVPTSTFTVLDSGEVEFAEPLGPADAVTVRYRTAAAGSAGDLMVGVGNRFALFPGLEAAAAFGMRWKPVYSSYSTAAGEYPGYVSASASARYSADDTVGLSATAAVGLSYSVSDTTGVLRIDGMDGLITTVSMTGSNLVPAPAPAADPDDADGIPLLPENRGVLLNRDYTTRGFLGQRETQSYLWDPPPSALYPYAAGGRIGPYPAVSNDSGPDDYAGSVMVMEYALSESANWVGAVSRIAGGFDQDLTGVGRIDGSLRATDESGNVRVFLQIGALAEDLDGDGVSDAGTGGFDPYFTFNDPATGWGLEAGTVDPATEAPYVEDADGDGRLDPELPDLVLTRELPTVTPADGWQTFGIDLTRAEQRVLRATRAVRFIIQRDAPGGERDGKMIFSDLRLYGAGFRVTSPAAVTVSTRTIPEEESPAEPLADAFPEVAARLDTPGGTPSVLAVNWSDLGSDTFTLSHTFTSVPARDYRQLRIYVCQIGAPGTVLTFRALSGPANTIVAERSFNPDDGWDELTLMLPADSTAEIHSVEVAVSGADTGDLVFDELSFWEPRDGAGATGAVSLEWKPRVNVAAGQTPVLDTVVVRQSVAARSSGYVPGLSATRTGIEGATDLSARVFGAPVALRLDLSMGPAGPGLQAAHQFTVPVPIIRTSLAEFFRRSYLSYGERLEHDIDLQLGPFGSATMDLGWHLDRGEDALSAGWQANARISATGTGGRALTSDLAFDGLQNRTEPLSPGTYAADWAESFRKLAPTRSAGDSRSLDAAGAFDATGHIAGLKLDGEAGTTYGSNLLATTLSVRIEAPFSVGDRIRITPSTGRTASYRVASSTPAFSTDVAEAAALLAAQSYLLTSLGVWELTASDTRASFTAATGGYRAAAYTPDLAIEVSRPITSSPWSVLIPSQGRLSIGRTIARNDDAVSDSRDLTSDISLTAPNVFGRLGSTPLFRFYDTDEIASSAAASLHREASGGQSLELHLDSEVSLNWLSGQSLTVATNLAVVVDRDAATGASSRDVRASADAGYTWERPAGDLGAFLGRLSDEDARFEHTESVEYTGAWTESASQTGTLTHRTDLRLSDRATVSAYGGVGLGLSGPVDARALLAGLRLGIEGALQF